MSLTNGRGGAGVRRTRRIYLLIKKNFKGTDLSSECAKAIKNGFHFFNKSFVGGTFRQ